MKKIYIKPTIAVDEIILQSVICLSQDSTTSKLLDDLDDWNWDEEGGMSGYCYIWDEEEL